METPEIESEIRMKPPFKTPILTKFSGIEPVLKGEGSYEQFKFQIKGTGRHTMTKPSRQG